ncbi:MAG TPA: hypothetical protein ENH29_05820 [Bacteroidetes bacterium]|nr:hypothetical protein [Bacteroidota bacterium]
MKLFLFTILLLFFLLECGVRQRYIISISGPREGAILSSDTVSVSFSVSPEDWFEKGYQIHVLLDRDHFRSLDKNLHITYSGLTQGAHALFAFICDRNGIAIKGDSALVIRNFFAFQKSDPLIDVKQPLLIVNQPQKEKFRGDEGLRILFDFIVLNARLGKTHRLHYNLDGKDFYLEQEKPVWIEEARRIGRHKLTVMLEKMDGQLSAENPFNKISKEFLVVEK